jgi:hypothetical protein
MGNRLVFFNELLKIPRFAAVISIHIYNDLSLTKYRCVQKKFCLESVFNFLKLLSW